MPVENNNSKENLKINFLKKHTPATHECPQKKFQPNRSCRFAGCRQHIYIDYLFCSSESDEDEEDGGEGRNDHDGGGGGGGGGGVIGPEDYTDFQVYDLDDLKFVVSPTLELNYVRLNSLDLEELWWHISFRF